jgi:hypothetical protein
MTTGKDTRLGDQDQARRRRGGAAEGLGASRESGRGRAQDREGLGLVKKPRGPRRPGGGGAGGPGGRPGGGRPRPAGGSRPRRQDSVEQPRTDENAVSAEGREQPVIEPQVETTPTPVADAPDTTTTQTKDDDQRSGD